MIRYQVPLLPAVLNEQSRISVLLCMMRIFFVGTALLFQIPYWARSSGFT